MFNVTTTSQRAIAARCKAQRLQAAYRAAVQEYRDYDAAALRHQCEVAEREAQDCQRKVSVG